MSSATPTQVTALRDFQRVPGVGPSMADDLWALGYRSVAELSGGHVDRCALYVFRCAVYVTSNERHNSELLKWSTTTV